MDEQLTILEVNRSDFRQHQSRWLKMACGSRAVLIKSSDPEEDRIVLDKQHWDRIGKRIEDLLETLSITMDRKLFNQILAMPVEALEEDLRLGKLHSLEDAFSD